MGPASAAEHSVSAANAAVLERLAHVRPMWTTVRPARDAVGLPDFTLLHAGPPYADPADPPPAVLSSAVLCCIYEGWASNESEAESLVANGRVKLQSAQSYGAVTPLAAVISPRTALVEVENDNGARPRRKAWSLLGSGAGPQIRFGTRDPAVLERMRWRDDVLAPYLADLLGDEPVDLVAVAAAGLTEGDDLHARTTAATAELRAILQPWPDAAERSGAEVDTMLVATPLFFLTLWMAACHLALDAAAADGAEPASTLVVAFAGNGRECGIRIAGQPDRWWTAPATSPAGPRLDPASAAPPALMTGDSGVIEAAGFGAYALANADEIQHLLAAWLPSDWDALPHLHLAHPPGTVPVHGLLWSMLDAAAIVADPRPAHALIAMLDANGCCGLLGRGIVTAPRAPFVDACASARGGTEHQG